MRTDQPVTIRRVDYTPPVFLVDDVRIELDLDPDDTRVRSTLRLRRNPDLRPGDARPAPLLLNGEGLSLVELRLDGQVPDPASLRIDNDTLTVDDVPEAFELVTVSRIAPARTPR